MTTIAIAIVGRASNQYKRSRHGQFDCTKIFSILGAPILFSPTAKARVGCCPVYTTFRIHQSWMF